MPRTQEELEAAAADVEHWLDELDPAVLDDPASRADDLRAITSARDVIAMGERQLAMAVAAARANGRSWGEIGLFLGVTKQAARKRFGGQRLVFELAEGPPVTFKETESHEAQASGADEPEYRALWLSAATELGPGPKSAIVVPLDAADIERLKDRADEEGTGFTQLARRWVLERLEVARPVRGRPTLSNAPTGATSPRRASRIPRANSPASRVVTDVPPTEPAASERGTTLELPPAPGYSGEALFSWPDTSLTVALMARAQYELETAVAEVQRLRDELLVRVAHSRSGGPDSAASEGEGASKT